MRRISVPFVGLAFLLLAFAGVWTFVSPAPKIAPLPPFPLLPESPAEVQEVPPVELSVPNVESMPLPEMPPLGDPGFHLTEAELLILTMAASASGELASGQLQNSLTALNEQVDDLVAEMEELFGEMTVEQEEALRRWLLESSGEAIHEKVVRDLVEMGFDVANLEYARWVGWEVAALRVGLIAETITQVHRMDQAALARARSAEPLVWQQLLVELEILATRQPVGAIRTDTNILWKSFWELSQKYK